MLDKDREAVVNYRIKRANETLQEVHVLIQHALWNAAVNRLYYACFYAVTALLITHKIHTQSHAGARQMFGLHFIKTKSIPRHLGRFYAILFDMRQSGDYEDFVEYSENDVLSLLEPAESLISYIQYLIEET